MSKIDGRAETAKEVRALFCSVVTPRQFKNEQGKEVGDAKFDITLSIPGADLKPLVEKAASVAKEKFPGRDLKDLKWPWMTSEKFADYAAKRAAKKGKSPAECETARAEALKLVPAGSFALKASSKFEVALGVLEGQKIIDATAANRAVIGKKFYNGCYVIPGVNFVAYTGKKVDDPDGVTAYLDSVLWVKDGERIGGGSPSASERFKHYAGTVTTEDPMEGIPI